MTALFGQTCPACEGSGRFRYRKTRIDHLPCQTCHGHGRLWPNPSAWQIVEREHPSGRRFLEFYHPSVDAILRWFDDGTSDSTPKSEYIGSRELEDRDDGHRSRM